MLEVIQAVKCDRCGKMMSSVPAVVPKDGNKAPLVTPKFTLTFGDDVKVEWIDLCEKCEKYVKKQLKYLVLPRKSVPKDKAARGKRKPRKAAATTTVTAPSAFPTPGAGSSDNGESKDKAPIVE